MEARTDWGSCVVVNPGWLDDLQAANATLQAKLQSSAKRLRRRQWLLCSLAALVAFGVSAGSVTAYRQANRIAQLTDRAREYRRQAQRADIALAALARSHENILAATQDAPSVGTHSWGHRFTITKYLARDPKYGKDNDGFTSTMWKADPAARIVAVDPKLIPYGSWVWIEALGWYRAQDCGGAIKGFRLDVMTGSESDAAEYGRQDRFVIVVPPTDA